MFISKRIAIILVVTVAVMAMAAVVITAAVTDEENSNGIFSITVNDGTNSMTISADGHYLLPDVTRPGYVFQYWVDSDTGEMIQPEGAITSNMSVEAVWAVAPVDDLDSLIMNIDNGADSIAISSDIEIDRPIFITDTVNIYSQGDHSLLRKDGYLGDLFVIGEDEDHSKPILKGKEPMLILGKDGQNGKLTVNGNDIASNGSAFLIVNCGKLVMNDNVTICNFSKTGNERLLDEDHYRVSYPNNVGGSAVTIINGTFEMNGGVIENNTSSTVDESSAYCGGAIYNYSTFVMNGGVIENNTSARGGAIFNYKIIHLNAGTVKDNSVTMYGGAIYCANSQYVNVFLGSSDAAAGSVLFENNVSAKAGGVLFAKSKCTVVSYGGTTFRNNGSTSSHGGVFYMAGTLNLTGSVFENNHANSQGGAIQLHNEEDLTPREVSLRDCTFIGNRAKSGGAIYNVSKGAVVISSCTFSGNKADITSSSNGGALYLYTNSNTLIENCTISNSMATANGGAVYTSGGAVSVFNDITATNNSAASGGFLYITTANTDVTLRSGEITSNTANNGSFFYGNANGSRIHLGSGLIYDGTKANKFTEDVIQ